MACIMRCDSRGLGLFVEWVRVRGEAFVLLCFASAAQCRSKASCHRRDDAEKLDKRMVRFSRLYRPFLCPRLKRWSWSFLCL